MIVGDLQTFAIDSEITLAYDRLSDRALGYFALHVMGRSYGIRETDATMLANVVDDVGRRIVERGTHKPPFAMDASAQEIAYSFRRAIYDESKKGELFFGMPASDFAKSISANRIHWSAYCDEAFDDSSYILHAEDSMQVRLIAFTGTSDLLYDPASLREVCLSPVDFYQILDDWHGRFLREWKSLPKVPDAIQ
jgi:hypothetical protein